MYVVADGTRSVVPIRVTVAPVTLPKPNQVSGSLLTGFNFSPQSYSNKAASLYGVDPDSTLPGLFSFLASYRLSPNSWGYGNPKTASGYTSDRRWWLDKTAQMVAAAGQPSPVRVDVDPDLEQPLEQEHVRRRPCRRSSRRRGARTSGRCTTSGRATAGSRARIRTCGGWTSPASRGFRVVQQQARVTHSCFPGSHVIVTGKPSAENRFLWNGGSDDVDVWAVLASRYYGEYTNPSSRDAASRTRRRSSA